LDNFLSLRKRLDEEVQEMVGNRKLMLEAIVPDRILVESSWARELWFSCLHATHHFALLRVIAVGELHLSIPDSFGVAPSTIVHRNVSQSQSEQAKREETPPKL